MAYRLAVEMDPGMLTIDPGMLTIDPDADNTAVYDLLKHYGYPVISSYASAIADGVELYVDGTTYRGLDEILTFLQRLRGEAPKSPSSV
jgi:hypothetical protein